MGDIKQQTVFPGVAKELKGTDDFELGIKRDSPLRYTLDLPDNGKAKGLVLVIPGFGADCSDEYQFKLRQHIVEKYNWAAASVYYHAIAIRPQSGGAIVIEQEDIQVLRQALLKRKLQVLPELEPNLLALAKVLVASGEKEAIPCSIISPNGDYQNFGVMQAIDHLLVLGEILDFIADPELPVVAFGSSHGGYLANLMAKFAPNTFAAVLDNSSYVTPPLNYIIGRQVGMPEYTHQLPQYPGILFRCFSRNRWALQRNLPNFFSRDRMGIRSFSETLQLDAMAKYGNCKAQYRFIHSSRDGNIAPFEEKKRYSDLLRKMGFDVVLKVVSEKDVDGTLVKNLDHGMGLSLKKMFEYFFPTITPTRSVNDFQLQSKIVYEGFLTNYIFEFSGKRVIPTVQNVQ